MLLERRSHGTKTRAEAECQAKEDDLDEARTFNCNYGEHRWTRFRLNSASRKQIGFGDRFPSEPIGRDDWPLPRSGGPSGGRRSLRS